MYYTMQFVSALLLLAASAFASPLNDNQRSESRLGVPSPAVVFVGKQNEVLRCLYEDPNECEVFSTTSTFVNSLCVSGEHLYVGLQKGVILKCNLYQKESCKNFHTGAGSEVNVLATANGYIYAALYSGTILRCVLDEPDSCRPFHVPGNNLFSLVHYNEYIYAGLGNGTLVRCSLTSENSCMQLYTMTSKVFKGIMGLSRVENNILAVAQKTPHLWKCTQKPDATIDYCESVTLNLSGVRIRNMVSFKGVLYMVELDKGIHICKWANNTECSSYGNFTGVWSMAFAFGAYYMQSRFHNEDKTCVWQKNFKCPPFITYYETQERAALEVHVKNGKLYNSQGLLVDTEDADVGEAQSGRFSIFVMRPDGTILLSNWHVTELLHTSSLLAGHPVSGAGEMVVTEGVIEKITTCSNHYRPDLNLNRQVVESLHSQWYTGNIKFEECSADQGRI